MTDLAALPYMPCNHRTARTGPVDLVVVHTNEGPEGPSSAEGLAAYLRTVDPGYNVVVDENSAVRTAADNEVVWGAGGVNSRAWHLCITGWSAQTAAQWDDAESRAALAIAADLVRQACAKLGVPATRITDSRPGNRGICGHVDVSRYYPASMGHTDPGPDFPWQHFLDLVHGAPTPAPPAPTPNQPTDLEDGPVRTIYYPFQHQQHTFWIDTKGHVRHVWENDDGTEGYEDLSVKLKLQEAVQVDRGLAVNMAMNTDLVVRGMLADGACLEMRYSLKTQSWGIHQPLAGR